MKEIMTVLPPETGSAAASIASRLQLRSEAQNHQGFPIKGHQCSNVVQKVGANVHVHRRVTTRLRSDTPTVIPDLFL